MSSVKVTRCYSITPLLNVILIIVVHYGIFVPMLIHLKLQKKIQKRALRYVYRQMTSPYEELLQICQMSPLYIVRLRKIAELVYMVSANICPTYLNNLFTNNSCNRAHNKQLPTFNTVKYGKRSIKHNGPQLWNSLPD